MILRLNWGLIIIHFSKGVNNNNRGCTSGRVYVPCFYTHARWELQQATQVTLLLYLCYVFWVLINSLVCWFGAIKNLSLLAVASPCTSELFEKTAESQEGCQTNVTFSSSSLGSDEDRLWYRLHWNEEKKRIPHSVAVFSKISHCWQLFKSFEHFHRWTNIRRWASRCWVCYARL